MNHNFSDRIKW